MITPEDLRAELDRRGRPMYPRTLTDWRAKGLLPPLETAGLGQGKGSKYFWNDSEVIIQAELAHQFLSDYAVTDITLLKLWTAGYDVPNERAIECWLSYLRKLATRNIKYANKKKDGLFGLLTSWTNRSFRAANYKGPTKNNLIKDAFTEHLHLIYDPEFKFEADLISGTIIDLFKMERSDENYEQVEEILLEIEPILMEMLPIKSVIPFVESISLEEMEDARKILRKIYLLIVRAFELTTHETNEFDIKYYACQLMRDIGRLLALCFIQMQRQGIELPIIESLNSIQSFANTLLKSDVIQIEKSRFELSENGKQKWQKAKSKQKLIWSN